MHVTTAWHVPRQLRIVLTPTNTCKWVGNFNTKFNWAFWTNNYKLLLTLALINKLTRHFNNHKMVISSNNSNQIFIWVIWAVIPFLAQHSQLGPYNKLSGLKVNDQLVACATRFLVVRLKHTVWSHLRTLKAKGQCNYFLTWPYLHVSKTRIKKPQTINKTVEVTQSDSK